MKQNSINSFRLTRRGLLGAAVGAMSTVVAPACRSERTSTDRTSTDRTSSDTRSRKGVAMAGNGQQGSETSKQYKEAITGQLLARPERGQRSQTDQGRPAGGEEAPRGLQQLRLGSKRDGLLYVPVSYRPERPAPFVLMLHGAGGSGQNGLNPIRHLADEAELILLAPDSRHSTWDVIVDSYGPDVTFINQALEWTFSRYKVDPQHLAVGGFSDGASYALSLGVANGDLFTHVLAFSPGFLAPARQEGQPRLYISHGTKDGVLPVEQCSRRIVPKVQRAGYDVLYREFDGPHTVPKDIAREAVQWFIKPNPAQNNRRNLS